jgi:TfoX/Sxy family transcriptional regulator of competence genes
MAKGSMPKPSAKAKEAFQALVPADPAVSLRPMFGNLSLFVNGNMFAGLFGEDLFVRLSEEDLDRVRRQGGRNFEVMPGRAMKGYVFVPGTWQKQPADARAWITKSLAWSRRLPAKKK